MCISKRVYETVGVSSVGYPFISTKSVGVLTGLHQCVLVLPLFQQRTSVSWDCTLEYQYWGILQVSEWQVGDYRDDGNVRGNENSIQYGRSFTRSLQGTCIHRLSLPGLDFEEGGKFRIVQFTFSLVVTKLSQRIVAFFSFTVRKLEEDYSWADVDHRHNCLRSVHSTDTVAASSGVSVHE